LQVGTKSLDTSFIRVIFFSTFKGNTVNPLKMRKDDINLPVDLIKQVDKFVERLDFVSREEFVKAAVRRLIDYYRSITIS